MEKQNFEAPVYITGSLTRDIQAAEDAATWVNPVAQYYSAFVEKSRADKIRQIAECKTMMLLPYWQWSEEARADVELGIQLGLEFIDEFGTGITPQQNALRVAENLTRGDRNRDYGHPATDYTCFGGMASYYLSHWLHSTGFLSEDEWLPPIPPEIGVVLMTLIKASRHAHCPTKEDTPADGAGYWSLVELIFDWKDQYGTPVPGERAAKRETE